MKGKKRIKLLKSQKILLQTKKQEIQGIIQIKQNELNQILGMIMVEQGVPEKVVGEWQLARDGQTVERIKRKG